MSSLFAVAKTNASQMFYSFSANFRGDMDDGVAYMVMGEGGEGGQATQVVAVDNGDGTQQLVSFFSPPSN